MGASKDNLPADDILVHYGVSKKDGAPGRGSGRYEIGSGARPRSGNNSWIDDNRHVIRGMSRDTNTDGSPKKGKSKTTSPKPKQRGGSTKDPYKLIDSSIKQLSEAKALLSNKSISEESRKKAAKQIAKVVDPDSKVDNADDAIALINKKLKEQEQKKEAKQKKEKPEPTEAKPKKKELSEAEKKQKEEAAAKKKQKQEEERKRKEAEAAEKKRQEEEARRQKEAEEKKQAEEAERKKKEEEAKQKREEEREERRQKHEERKLELLEKIAAAKQAREEAKAAKRKEREEHDRQLKEKIEAEERAEKEAAEKALKLAEEAERRSWLSNPRKFMEHVAELTPEERAEFVDIQRSKSYAEQQRVDRIVNGFAYVNAAKDGLIAALDTYDKVSSIMTNYKQRKTQLEASKLQKANIAEALRAAKEYTKQMESQTLRYQQSLVQDKALFDKNMERLTETSRYEKEANDRYLSSLDLNNSRMEILRDYEKNTRTAATGLVNGVFGKYHLDSGGTIPVKDINGIRQTVDTLNKLFVSRDNALGTLTQKVDNISMPTSPNPNNERHPYNGPAVTYPNIAKPESKDNKDNKGGGNNNQQQNNQQQKKN